MLFFFILSSCAITVRQKHSWHKQEWRTAYLFLALNVMPGQFVLVLLVPIGCRTSLFFFNLVVCHFMCHRLDTNHQCKIIRLDFLKIFPPLYLQESFSGWRGEKCVFWSWFYHTYKGESNLIFLLYINYIYVDLCPNSKSRWNQFNVFLAADLRWMMMLSGQTLNGMRLRLSPSSLKVEKL